MFVSKADIELALHKTGMRKDRLFTNLEQQKRKLDNSKGLSELQLHKSEVRGVCSDGSGSSYSWIAGKA